MTNKVQDKRLEHIYRLVASAQANLDSIKDALERLDLDQKRDQYRNVEGIVGTYDGTSMLTASGEHLEVPANYAAKSRLVFGDTLKLIEEDGKQVFKQIEKVKRKRIEGILTKKEGKWYILSDAGSYKISDIAADFNHAELNDEAVAFIPDGDPAATFAALDKLNKKLPEASQTSTIAPVTAPKVEPKAPLSADLPFAPKPSIAPKPRSAAKPKTAVAAKTPKPAAKPTTFVNKPFSSPVSDKPKAKEFVQEIIPSENTKGAEVPRSLDDDDLR